jgi:hypothetical protein
MGFRCKVVAKAAVAQYGIPAEVLAVVNLAIDGMRDNVDVAEGLMRVIEVNVNGHVLSDRGDQTSIKIEVNWRLLYGGPAAVSVAVLWLQRALAQYVWPLP